MEEWRAGAAVPWMYEIAIIGAGPAGLSAAARAAERERQARRATPGYILLEGFSAHAKTIQRYQKGKHVMAEPGFLDLRSDLGFAAGSREKVLADWGAGAAETRRQHPLRRRSPQGHRPEGRRSRSSSATAKRSGRARRAGDRPGGQSAQARRARRGPGTASSTSSTIRDEFRDETILVVGAGDSAIENALALAEQNDVWISTAARNSAAPRMPT